MHGPENAPIKAENIGMKLHFPSTPHFFPVRVFCAKNAHVLAILPVNKYIGIEEMSSERKKYEN